MTENNAAQILDAIRTAGYRDHPTNIERKRVDAILLAVEPLLCKLGAEGVQAGDEREAFEAWANNDTPESANLPLPRNSLGDYEDERADGAWHGWNAHARRAALASAPVAGAARPVAWAITVPKEVSPVYWSRSEEHANEKLPDYPNGTVRRVFLDAAPQASEEVDLSAVSDIALEDEIRKRGAWVAPQSRETVRPSIPPAKRLPDLKMASYHEAIGWNACRAATLQSTAQADKDGGDCAKSGAEAGLPDIEPEPRTATDYPVALGGYSAHVADDRHSCASCGDPRSKSDCTSVSGEAMQLAESLRDWHGKGDGVTTAIPDELAQALYGYLYDAAEDPIRALIAKHAELLEGSDYAYFELARTRATGWLAWLCSHPAETHPDRKVLACGQGNTPDEACRLALADFDRRAKGE